MNEANNLRLRATTSVTDYAVYNTLNIKDTLARSRQLIKSNSFNAELKSISTQTLSHERAF